MGPTAKGHGQSGCLRQYLDAAKAETDGMNSNGFMDGLMVRQLDVELIVPFTPNFGELKFQQIHFLFGIFKSRKPVTITAPKLVKHWWGQSVC